MTQVLILLGVFNAGFLVGAWWGSGWRRRQREALRAELETLRHELAAHRETLPTSPEEPRDRARRRT